MKKLEPSKEFLKALLDEEKRLATELRKGNPSKQDLYKRQMKFKKTYVKKLKEVTGINGFDQIISTIFGHMTHEYLKERGELMTDHEINVRLHELAKHLH